jgi:hypothetical protein
MPLMGGVYTMKFIGLTASSAVEHIIPRVKYLVFGTKALSYMDHCCTILMPLMGGVYTMKFIGLTASSVVEHVIPR